MSDARPATAGPQPLSAERVAEPPVEELRWLSEACVAAYTALGIHGRGGPLSPSEYEILAKGFLELLDPPICRLQFPDGGVPGNLYECAHGWRRAYYRLLTSWNDCRERLRQAEARLPAETAARETAERERDAWERRWQSKRDLADSYRQQRDTEANKAEAAEACVRELETALRVLVSEKHSHAPGCNCPWCHARAVLAALQREGQDEDAPEIESSPFSGVVLRGQAARDFQRQIGGEEGLPSAPVAPSAAGVVEAARVKAVLGEVLSILKDLHAMIWGECPSLLEDDHHNDRAEHALSIGNAFYDEVYALTQHDRTGAGDER